MKFLARLFAFISLALFIAALLPAQAGSGEELTIKVALFGPGDELFAWWGHAALIITDNYTRQSISYDFGLFSYEDNDFFKNLVFGKLLYSCGPSSAENNINFYTSSNRDVILYTLDISPAKKKMIRDFAENSILPENRYYYYQFFKDNCSTRIRDIVDIAVDGKFKERFANETSPLTLRQQGRRYIWFSPITDWFLCFIMGRDIDKPVSIWDTMFLPSELTNSINNFIYSDENGFSRKLVSNVEVICIAQGRFITLDSPKNLWPQGLAAGFITALFLVIIFFAELKIPQPGRVLLGITHSLFGLLFGTAGLLLFFLNFFTQHDYAFHNINLLFINPLLLAAIPLGIKCAISANNNKRLLPELLLRLIWLLTALGTIISMLIKLNPMFRQENSAYQFLMLPIALLLSLVKCHKDGAAAMP